MPSDTSLKILIALNAVQIFITLLLIATMASTGINAKSSQAGYGGIGSRPSGVEDPFDDPSLGSSSGGALQASDSLGEGVIPPGAPTTDDAPAIGSGPGDPSTEALASTEDPDLEAKKAERNKVILRTYLNLVARRLEISAKDSDFDASPYLPNPDTIDAAIASGDTESEDFQGALATLKAGYDALNMDFPSPPGSKAKGEEK